MRRYLPLLMILVLLGSLAVVEAAPAAAATPTAPAFTTLPLPAAHDAAPEPEEEEFVEGEEGEEEGEFEVEEEVLVEECEATAEEFEFENEAEEEEFEEEAEECEEEIKKGKGTDFVTAPAACVVQKAESSITTLPGTDRVRLTIHYTNYSSASVAIGLKLKDHKGSLALEHTMRKLGHDGTLHLTTKLGEAEMARAEDAREFDVSLRAVNTPGYCSDLLEQHLKTKAPPKAQGSRAHGSRVFSAPKQG